MVKKLDEMNTGELAAWICSHLKKHGIDVVLSGDACVSIYTGYEFVADDLDFIEVGAAGKKRLAEVMSLIGFATVNSSSRHFVHPGVKLTVEFPAGPLMVGQEPPSEITKLNFETVELSLLSPTDCIKDRLLWFFNDPNRNPDHPCLAQALMVVQEVDVDWQELERWAEAERELEAYQYFKTATGMIGR